MNVLVANARHIKAVPGWKTDVKDAEWIADLLRHGLIRGSAIPSRARRELREMVRYRLSLSRQRAQVAHRIQKVLEGANVKLSSVVTDLTGVSGRAMLEALITGTDSPDIIADLARGSWWSRLGCAQYDATDQDRRCARSTVPRAVDQRRMQARASADCEALSFGCLQELTPLLVGGNLRQLRETWYQPALSMPRKTAAWRVAPPPNGIALTQTLLDEVVVEQADRHQAELHGCIC